VATNNTSSDPVTPTPVSSLKIEKTLVGDLVSGKDATYDIVVSNGGPSPASQVEVKDALPAGLSGVSASGDGWRCKVSSDQSVITCDRDSLGVHETSDITLIALVDAHAGDSIINHAVASSTTQSVAVGADTASSGPATVQPGPVKSKAVSAATLAFTGMNFVPIGVGGFILILVGISLLFGSRRRRTTG
jgi:uncharacterized repeat protein (TIGR01451 family)